MYKFKKMRLFTIILVVVVFLNGLPLNASAIQADKPEAVTEADTIKSQNEELI